MRLQGAIEPAWPLHTQTPRWRRTHIRKGELIMTLTVKGQDGHTYRVTGKFAEPEHNQPFWNFDRGEVNFYQKPVGWTGKHPFGNRAVLLERVEAAYEVTVTLDEKQIEHLRGHLLNCACRD